MFMFVTHINKKRGAGLLPVPRYQGSRIARIVETSNAETPHRMNIYRPHQQNSQNLAYMIDIIIPWGVPVAWLLTIRLNLRDSSNVKPKRTVTPFINMSFPHPNMFDTYRKYSTSTQCGRYHPIY